MSSIFKENQELSNMRAGHPLSVGFFPFREQIPPGPFDLGQAVVSGPKEAFGTLKRDEGSCHL